MERSNHALGRAIYCSAMLGSRWKWVAIIGLLAIAGIMALWLAFSRPGAVAENGGRPEGRMLPSLAGAIGLSRAASPDSLSGHVVVVAFLSLDLPRSLRAASTLTAWHDAYSRYGVRVLGVHVPAFAFAADSTRSARASQRLGLRFPVALDASLEVARAFGGVSEPPRIIVADPGGRVVWDQEGDSALPEAERLIRELVLKADPGLRFPAGVPPPADAGAAEHAAVHLGRARVERGPLAEVPAGRAASFTAQLRYQVEGQAYTPYPVGRWTPAADGLVAARGGAQNFVALRYDAGALGAVIGPPEEGPARVWILRDDRWLTPSEAGHDVEIDGRGASYVTVAEPRLYALTRMDRGDHVIKLSPDEAGTTIYAFTFGTFEAPQKRP